jgi:hypothetical protein
MALLFPVDTAYESPIACRETWRGGRVDIAWDITPDDLEALAIGANVLGTGGGGNPYTVRWSILWHSPMTPWWRRSEVWGRQL